MRKLIVLAVALAMAATAAPAFASVQNVKIGGWTNNTFVHRQEFDLGKGSGGTDTQDVFINQTGLQVDADLTDQVYVTIALINEAGWGAERSENSTASVDIYLAYVTLKEMLYSPLTLVVGRQVFSFGNGLVFDATGTNNTAPGASGISSIAADLTKQTSLDAIRAIFDYNPLTVTVFYAKVHQNTQTINHLDDDKDLWGVNANYQLGDDMDSVIETYFFKQRDKEGNVGLTGAKTDYIKVVGVRASTNPIEGLNLQAEVAHQGGSARIESSPLIQRKRDAWAVQGIVNYQLPVLEEYKPVAQYIFTKTTGETDTDANLTNYTGWDPFYEAQGGGHIYNTLFDLTNSVIHSFYLTAEPMEDITARLALTAIWLERELKEDSIETRLPTGSTQELLAKTDSSYLGKEINFDLTYDYTEDVTFGTSLGWFFPRSVFDNENNSTAKQALVSMNVSF